MSLLVVTGPVKDVDRFQDWFGFSIIFRNCVSSGSVPGPRYMFFIKYILSLGSGYVFMVAKVYENYDEKLASWDKW